MALKVTKIDVWSGELGDYPGGLAGVLRELAGATVDLEMVVARRRPEKPGKAIVFLAPLKGRNAVQAAARAGLGPDTGMAALRVEGPNRAGLGAKLVGAIAAAGINLRGLSAAVVGRQFAAFLAFDSAPEAAKAARAIKASVATRSRSGTKSKV